MDPADSRRRDGIRLDAYLARAGLGSRREARAWIRRGDVTLDGVICRDPAQRIRVGAEVALRDRTIASPVEETDFLMHKPLGYACSHDPREAPRVFDLLPEDLAARRLRIAGRLDRATTGLLILTSRGDLVHRLTHPRRKLPKRYRIEYAGRLCDDAEQRCESGLMLSGDERPTRPAKLRRDGEGRAILVLTEGRTHQVRRMIRTLGGEVRRLHRDRIGGLELPLDLEPGAIRPLASRERELLCNERSL